jgi:hypothetical protein
MSKWRHTELMIGIGLAVFIMLMALAPLVTRAGDLDDRSRRGWWSNH